MGSSPRLQFRSDTERRSARAAPGDQSPISEAEERALARAWRERGDADAMQRLVTAHSPLAHQVAWLYRDRGLPHQELVDEGIVGLTRAAARFDPDCGFRFATYAAHWVGMQVLALVLARCADGEAALGHHPDRQAALARPTRR